MTPETRRDRMLAAKERATDREARELLASARIPGSAMMGDFTVRYRDRMKKILDEPQ